MRHTFGLTIGLVLATHSVSGRARTKAVAEKRACEVALTEPAHFGSIQEARAVVGPLRAHVGRHLGPAELATLDRVLGYHTADADDLRVVAESLARARANFAREFDDLADLADEAIAARIKSSGKRGRPERDRADRERSDTLAGVASLRTKFKACRQNPTFEACAGVWRRIQNEFKLKRSPKTYPSRQNANLGRPADEVSRLFVLGGDERREQLRRALERTAESRGARARQAYRDAEELASQGRRHEYLRTTNLNRALEFFLEPPQIGERTSKVILSGPVHVGRDRVAVEVVFDPRDRYVTVQRPGGEGDERFYYRLALAADGRLIVEDQVPLAKGEVFKNLHDTHLGY